MKQKWKKSATLAALALMIGWLVFLSPTALGGPVSYTIVSGTSMEPRLHTGDLLLMRRTDEYQIGDIASYRIPEGQLGAGDAIVHRIKSGDGASGYRTPGDDVDRADPWSPTQSDMIGKLFLRIPGAGLLLMFLRSPLGIAAIAGLATGYLVLKRSDKESPRSEDTASVTHAAA